MSMLGRRLVALVPLMGIVTLATFSLIFLIPGDPAHRIAGEGASPSRWRPSDRTWVWTSRCISSSSAS